MSYHNLKLFKNTMGPKRDITSFFKTSSVKRTSTDNSVDTPSKIQKIDGAVNTVSLSPEQQRRMEENKKQAMEKLVSNKCSSLGIGKTWMNVLQEEFNKPYYKKLDEFVSGERKKHTIYPPEQDVFSWTRYTNLEDLKVVLIGQDPYHQPKQAHGLCFSVQVGVRIPPSLLNMYKELETDIPGFKRPTHGYLVGWAKQGVLLLNAVLTVQDSKPNAHKDKGWEKFTDATIKWINTNMENVVFILWGAYAQKKGSFINKSKHHVITGPHPSPLSASRGFFGSKPFSKANTYLKSVGKKEVDWLYLPESLN